MQLFFRPGTPSSDFIISGLAGFGDPALQIPLVRSQARFQSRTQAIVSREWTLVGVSDNFKRLFGRKNLAAAA
jgi:hypothetical protein